MTDNEARTPPFPQLPLAETSKKRGTMTESTQTPGTAARAGETPRQILIRTAQTLQHTLGAALGTLAREERRQGLKVLERVEDFVRLLQTGKES